MNKYSKIIEVKGHLIDSLVLTKIFDRVMDLDGKFEVMKISVGKLKTDESYAKLRIIGKNKTHLSEIMTALHREGATTKTQKNSKTKSASKNNQFNNPGIIFINMKITSKVRKALNQFELIFLFIESKILFPLNSILIR